MTDNNSTSKRADAQIYLIGHKELEYGYWSNSLYTVIEAGAALRDSTFAEIKDSKYKDNASKWNTFLNEASATYWVWKHAPKKLEWIGQCQYRRRLEFSEDADFNAVAEGKKIIMPSPMDLGVPMWEQYSKCHSEDDLRKLELIITSKYPDYADDFRSVIKRGRKIYYSAGMIARHEDFNAYCDFLFGVLRDFREAISVSTPEEAVEYVRQTIASGARKDYKGVEYQRAIGGFLAERIMTLWVMHNFKFEEIEHVQYLKFEGV